MAKKRPKSRQEKLREEFMFWWPVLARVAGIAGAFAQGAYAVVTRQSADAGFLAFCGALIAAPAIFDSQDRRNRGAPEAEEEEG